MVKHTSNELTPRVPATYMFNNTRYVSFRDVFYNIILAQMNNFNYEDTNKKMQTLTTQNTMSPKHRKRLERQLKRRMMKLKGETKA